MNAVDLAVRITSDASDAAAGFDATADAAKAMAREVTSAARSADIAVSRIDRTAEAADGLDSKAAQATSSLGALSSGFELVGLEKYAAGLQSAALATDFFSGVGEGLNLIMNATALASARARVAAIAHAAASRVTAAATRAAALAQRVLNLAMAASPIGLLVAGVVALVAVIVLAYRRSERFRAVVDTAMAGARRAVGWVVDRLVDLAETAARVWALVRDTATRAWSSVRDKAAEAWSAIVQRVLDARDRLVDAATGIKDKFVSGFSAMLSPIQSVIDKIQWLIDKIRSIPTPRLPDVNPFTRLDAAFARSIAAGQQQVAAGPPPPVQILNITINGAVDPYATAKQVEQMLGRRARIIPRVVA